MLRNNREDIAKIDTEADTDASVTTEFHTLETHRSHCGCPCAGERIMLTRAIDMPAIDQAFYAADIVIDHPGHDPMMLVVLGVEDDDGVMRHTSFAYRVGGTARNLAFTPVDREETPSWQCEGDAISLTIVPAAASDSHPLSAVAREVISCAMRGDTEMRSRLEGSKSWVLQ